MEKSKDEGNFYSANPPKQQGVINVNTPHGPMPIVLPMEAAKLMIKITEQKAFVDYHEKQISIMLQDVSVRRTQLELIKTMKKTLGEITFHYGDTSMTFKKGEYTELEKQIQGIINRTETNIESFQVRLRPAKEFHDRLIKEFNYLVDQARGLRRPTK